VRYWIILLLLAGRVTLLVAAPFTVATYNLEFYVDKKTLGVSPKSDEARAIIRQSIRAMNPDIIALQEVGTTNALLELRDALETEGLHFPFWQHVRGNDSNLHVAYLSKLPFTAVRHHTRESFLHQGRRFHVLRGFGQVEVEFQKQKITLITTHLKSKRQTAEADQEEIRIQESILLREKIDEHLKRDPNAALIVLGDFNDGVGTRTYSTIIGRGRAKLFDTRPHEKNGDSLPNPNPRYDPRRINWTHFYAKEETFSRIDMILLSPNLQKHYQPEQSYVLALANWGAGSDHRPVCVRLKF
jgi:endonuclease/exonuclease/phosphatase family metal-dependent hydrolase